MNKFIFIWLRQVIASTCFWLLIGHVDAQVCNNARLFTPEISYGGNPSRENFIMRYNEGMIYILPTNTSHDIYINDVFEVDTLYEINPVNNITTKYPVMHGVRKEKGQRTATDFLVKGDKMYVLGNKSMFIFQKNGPVLEYVDSVSTEYAYCYILGNIGDKLILYQATNYHPKDQAEKVLLGAFSITKNMMMRTREIVMKGVEFTYSNKRYATISGNEILFGQPFASYISLYNESLDSTGRIDLQIDVDDPKIVMKEYSTIAIQALLHQDINYCRVVKLAMVDSMLWVIYKQKNKNFRHEVMVDIYHRKENKWIVADTSINVNFLPKTTDVISPSSAYIPYIINNNPLISIDGYVYEVDNNYLPHTNTLTTKEYDESVRKAFFSNALYLKIISSPIECIIN